MVTAPTDTTGFFDSKFNTNIVINPNSKIGLISFAGQLQAIEEIFNKQEVIFKGYGGDAIDENSSLTYIDNGLYNRSNYDKALQSLQDGLNLQLVFNAGIGGENEMEVLGGEFSVRLENARAILEFRLAYNSANIVFNFVPYNIDTVAMLDPVSPLLFAGVMANSTDSFIESNVIPKFAIASGCGYMEVQINKMVIDPAVGVGDVQRSGFLMGWSKTDLRNVSPVDIKEDMLDYCIGIGSEDGANYIYYSRQKDEVITSATNPTYVGEGNVGNDHMMIFKDGSDIIVGYGTTMANLTPIDIFSIEHDFTPYYPFIILNSPKTYIKLKFEGASLDPYSLPLDQQDTRTGILVNPIYDPAEIPAPLKEFDLTDASEFRSFFGFTQAVYNQEVVSPNYKVQAENDFRPGLSASSCILEIFNLNVESYDSSQKQRRNILSSLISSDDQDRITKDDGNVIFLDINNKDKVDLRNIKLRLMDGNYNSVSTVGRCVATLLLADQNEKSF